mgnify:FL=1|jgi:hypothetical protein|tara:strand:+ start:423 stop:638 length:216 start_codon:yes stop_codon:yes gene_type:complete
MPISRAQMRKQISSSPAKKKRAKVKKVMKEFKKGKLRSGGSGKKVKNRKQAVAIALSEAGVSKKKRKARRP